MTVHSLIHEAFRRLVDAHGFTERDSQLQLSLIISDLIEESTSGTVEAPTGLGKSIAALIPAIAHGIVDGKRTVIATYTNVLAEQYWRKDLPLALTLFEDAESLETAFLVGRQRYVCRIGLFDAAPQHAEAFLEFAELGIDSEFRAMPKREKGEWRGIWSNVAAPPVCPGRLCSEYNDCFLFQARRRAERAHIVITNHAVVLQDALSARDSEEGVGMLGAYDFLVVDEGHDLIQSAQSGLEFDLSIAELNLLKGLSGRIENTGREAAESMRRNHEWHDVGDGFRSRIDDVALQLSSFESTGILATSPNELMEHPNLARAAARQGIEEAKRIGYEAAFACATYVGAVVREIELWEEARGETSRTVRDSIRAYLPYIQQMGGEAAMLFEPAGASVSYAKGGTGGAELRSDPVSVAEPLDELIWSRKPSVLLSATMTIDGAFEFVNRTLGFSPPIQEILPSPFDFGAQAALYIPKSGVVPDPTLARSEGTEEAYYDALAAELARIIRAVDGRTLALFHSRKEMEAVADRIDLPPELPIHTQYRSGASTAGDKFRSDVRSSLFALRSFWTGFDAPGETLSCVALVRIPFEVPVDPPALARMAYLESMGLNPFLQWTLPMAKMMIRQGAGRLIRSTEDRGVIALIDPRFRTKRYGEEILDNLPAEMRRFDEIDDAIGWIGLQPCSLNVGPEHGPSSSADELGSARRSQRK